MDDSGYEADTSDVEDCYDTRQKKRKYKTKSFLKAPRIRSYINAKGYYRRYYINGPILPSSESTSPKPVVKYRSQAKYYPRSMIPKKFSKKRKDMCCRDKDIGNLKKDDDDHDERPKKPRFSRISIYPRGCVGAELDSN